METNEFKVCIVGLGYVGLPLAVEFSKKFKTLGFDINVQRVNDLKKRVDITKEANLSELNRNNIEFTNDEKRISECNFIIVAVPTPVDDDKNPDLVPVEKASEIVGKNIRKGAIIVYESTVYPGVTEDICRPILSKYSGLNFGEDFKIGYSPERINPGDKEHSVKKIVKVVSGSDLDALEKISFVYSQIIDAGIYKAKNIKIAEAAKIIENIQRDVNIALMNEISQIFNKMGIDMHEMLKAAGTKWNFHRYSPGLVGGHCIGVDPYYLTYRAKQLGYEPKLILAGRIINENMVRYIIDRVKTALESNKISLSECNVLVMGITFKENITDARNSKSIELIQELSKMSKAVYFHDPITPSFIIDGKKCCNLSNLKGIDCVILAVPHTEYVLAGIENIIKMIRPWGILFDVKGVFKEQIENKDIRYLSL